MAENPSLIEQLRAATHAAHENLDHFMGANQTFKTKENYAKFLQIQEVFHKIVDKAYNDPKLNEKIPHLTDLGRYDRVVEDMQVLNVGPLHIDDVPELSNKAEKIGWLYCAEGSNLGAAFLFKDAQALGFDEQKGAKHLAAHPAGRGKHWREFSKYYNELTADADAAEYEDIIRSAKEAFTFYTNLARQALLG